MLSLETIILSLNPQEMAAAVKNLIALKSTANVFAKGKDATRTVAAQIAKIFIKYLNQKVKIPDKQKRE